MDTIEGYVRGAKDAGTASGQDSAYFSKRAARHQQEADRLYRLGDDRQAAMHASISRKHLDSAKLLNAGEAP